MRVSEICVNKFVLTKNLVYSEKMPSEGLELVLINDVSQPNFFLYYFINYSYFKKIFQNFLLLNKFSTFALRIGSICFSSLWLITTIISY